MSLHVASGLDLPADHVTKTCGILAQRRKGKTYTACVIAEEMVDAGLPFVAIDPTGAWWGLRASADAHGAGKPVTIIGGQHGDVPLERGAGKELAEFVVDTPGWYVLDLTLLGTHAAEREFATDFAERLYRRKGRADGDAPLHLFVDEADMFAPQRSPSGDQRMLGAFEQLVRRGGLRGIGTTLISQRAAVVNKNVLEQLDVLVALRTVGPNDRKAIDEYVKAYATPEQRAEVMASLPRLATGEAWWYEPGEDLLRRVTVRERETFNSSATPKAGEARVEPARLADVDLDRLKERLSSAVERARADDPRVLRAENADLRAEVARLTAEGRPAAPMVVEVPVVPDGARAALAEATRVAADVAVDVGRRVGDVVAALDHARGLLDEIPGTTDPGPPRPPVSVVPGTSGRVERPVSPPPRRAPAEPASRPAPPPGDLRPLGDGAPRRMLEALADHHPERRTRAQLAAEAGIRRKASTVRNAMTVLRSGYVTEDGDLVGITDAGLAIVGRRAERPTGEALLDYWRSKLGDEGAAPRRLFDVLVDAWPGTLERAEAARRAEIDPSKSTIRNALTKLRLWGLVNVAEGMLRADVDVMEAAGR